MLSGCATARPTVVPIAAKTRLSTSIWRIWRARSAPSAARTAISRARRMPRASSRLATLADASTSSSAAAAISASDVRALSPTSDSRSGVIAKPTPRLTTGRIASARAAIASSSACACAGATPGASRANTAREASTAGSTRSGIHASTS